MIVLEQGLNGYESDGLNGGLKIAKALKKVNLKGAIKVVKTVAPIALSMIPVVGGAVGGIAGKILNKVTTNSDGSANLVGRAISGTNSDGSANLVGRVTDTVKEIAKSDLGKSVANLAAPLVKNATASVLQQKGEIPTDAQLATIADAKGTTPQQELDAMVTAKTAQVTKTATPTVEPKKDNTMLIVGGIAAVGIAYAILK